MHIIDYQNITADDLNLLDNTVIVYDGCLFETLHRCYCFVKDINKLHQFITLKKHAVSIEKFKLGEYIEDILPVEVRLLKERVDSNPQDNFFIQPLGLLINGGDIFFYCIRPLFPDLFKDNDNVYLMWNNIPDAKEVYKNKFIISSYNERTIKYSSTYNFLKKLGNKVDINRLNNKHIPIELINGIYVEEKVNEE